jgi:hypothetical protein
MKSVRCTSAPDASLPSLPHPPSRCLDDPLSTTCKTTAFMDNVCTSMCMTPAPTPLTSPSACSLGSGCLDGEYKCMGGSSIGTCQATSFTNNYCTAQCLTSTPTTNTGYCAVDSCTTAGHFKCAATGSCSATPWTLDACDTTQCTNPSPLTSSTPCATGTSGCLADHFKCTAGSTGCQATTFYNSQCSNQCIQGAVTPLSTTETCTAESDLGCAPSQYR